MSSPIWSGLTSLERSGDLCLRTPDVARWRSPDVDSFTVDDHVYPFLSNQSDHESIIKAARETHWYPSIGVISSLKRGEPLLEPGSAQSVSILDDLVTRIDAVLVGAYDTESWLVWYPDHGLDAIS
jgi:hypothetical protein